jgi:hypothetical protein
MASRREGCSRRRASIASVSCPSPKKSSVDLPGLWAAADNDRMGDQSSGLLPRRAAQVERLDAALPRAVGGQPIVARLSDLRR